jgi:hypothetical protein
MASYTRHLNKKLGGQLATEPLPVYILVPGPLERRLIDNHHALLSRLQTGQLIAAAVMAPRTVR